MDSLYLGPIESHKCIMESIILALVKYYIF